MGIREHQPRRAALHILVTTTAIRAGETQSPQLADEIASLERANLRHSRDLAHGQVNAVNDRERLIVCEADE